MKKPILALLALVLPVAATAGEIYGKVTFNNAPVSAGTEVAARCGDRDYPAVQTDKAGSYSLVVAETGKCQLTIAYQGESATVAVASYEDAAQADVALSKQDGKLAARRR